MRWRDERSTRQPRAADEFEVADPPAGSGGRRRRPPTDRSFVEDQTRGLESTTAVQESAEQVGRDAVGRVGDHVEGPAWQPQVPGVGLHHGDRPSEVQAEVCRSGRVGLDGDHAVAGVDEWRGDGAATGAHVEHQRRRRESGVSDESVSDVRVELVPSPPLPLPGHGRGPPSAGRSCCPVEQMATRTPRWVSAGDRWGPGSTTDATHGCVSRPGVPHVRAGRAVTGTGRLAGRRHVEVGGVLPGGDAHESPGRAPGSRSSEMSTHR